MRDCACNWVFPLQNSCSQGQFYPQLFVKMQYIARATRGWPPVMVAVLLLLSPGRTTAQTDDDEPPPIAVSTEHPPRASPRYYAESYAPTVHQSSAADER